MNLKWEHILITIIMHLYIIVLIKWGNFLTKNQLDFFCSFLLCFCYP